MLVCCLPLQAQHLYEFEENSQIEKIVQSVDNCAYFTVNPKSDICTSDPVLVTNKSPVYEGLSYEWNFAGSDITTQSGYYPEMVNYSDPGQYTITLSIQGPSGCSESYSKTIDVLESCCDHN